MYSMPKGLTAATGMDALTHAIESYITPGAWAMSDMFELKAIEMIAVHLKAAVDNGSDPVAREAMSQAQIHCRYGVQQCRSGHRSFHGPSFGCPIMTLRMGWPTHCFFLT